MKALRNPIVLVILGLGSGLAAGLGWFMRAADLIVAKTHVAPPPVVTEEQRAQGWDFWTIEVDNLANELKEERERQKKQAEVLEQREGRIAAEQKELERIRSQIEQMRAEVEQQVMAMTDDERKNLRTLAQTYTNLTPKAAVAIIKDLDDSTVVKIFSLMKPDVVGPIFEEMTRTPVPGGTMAQRAAELSDKIRLIKAVKTAT